MNYAKAKDLLTTAKDAAKGKPLANNTRLFPRGKDIAVRLHSTDILTLHSNGSVTLNTGGWHTVTTKDRLNTYLPGNVKVYSNKGVWTLYVNGKPVSEYYDGIRVSKAGKVLGKRIDPRAGKAREAKLQRCIAKYIKGYLTHISQGKLVAPSPGDCLLCQAKAWGDKDASHLLTHMKEGYYVPSLLLNAIKETYNPTFAGMFYSESMPNSPRHIDALTRHSTPRHALQRYFRRRKRALIDAVKAGKG